MWALTWNSVDPSSHCSDCSMSRQLLVAFLLHFVIPAMGRIIAGAVLPHGDFAYDPNLLDDSDQRAAALRINQATNAVAAQLRDMQPDLIVLSTPHGMALSNDVAVYLNSKASGYAPIGQDLHSETFKPYKVSLNITMADDIAKRLAADFEPIAKLQGLGGFANSDDMPIRWGEVIPLSFLQHLLESNTKVLIISQPLRRYNQSVQMTEELWLLGQKIAQWIEADKETANHKVAFVVSADLAHTHSADGPYGFSPAAAPFDEAVSDWASSFNRQRLLGDASSLQNDAKSCGYTGMVLLQGVVDGICPASLTQPITSHECWTPHVYGCEHPTYYGMMASLFVRN